MEQPPALPDARPPFGSRFYFLLFTPLVLMTVSFCCVNIGDLAAPVLIAAAIATLVCSVLLAILLARRLSKTGDARVGMGILMFFAVQAFYGICFFIGCTATVMVS